MKFRCQRFALLGCLAAAILTSVGACSVAEAEIEPPAPAKTATERAFREGNWADAYDGYRVALTPSELTGQAAAIALSRSVSCLRNLNRIDEFDAFIESVVDAHPDDWRLLAQAAESYTSIDHSGRLVDGQFKRGRGRGRAKIVYSQLRDRVRAMQLNLDAIEAAKADDEQREAATVLLRAANALMQQRQGQAAWRLQELTDLSELPDYETDRRNYWFTGSSSGAPVTADGDPVLYEEPASWDAAANDGERVRWLLAEAVRWNPANRLQALEQRANFSLSQFGVQTIRGSLGRYTIDDDGERRRSNLLTLHTLTDDETVARLATGVKRFKLPPEHHYLALYQQRMDAAPSASIASQLGQLYLDRRQFPKAAEYFRKAIGLSEGKAKPYQAQLNQIVGAWGQFEPSRTQPADEDPTIGFRFRNTTSVELCAQPIDISRLISDVKTYLKSNPKRLDWQQIDIAQIGYRILDESRQKYIGKEVARWKVDLDPAADHFDRRTTLTTPLEEPGAYFVTATVDGGNTSHIVMWVADTAIVRKPQGDKELFYVADARTGAPIPHASLELFGYQQQQDPKRPNSFSIDTASFAAKTNDLGMASLRIARDQLAPDFGWLAVASTQDGRKAFLGFDRFWTQELRRNSLDRSSAYLITDRPFYRPEQTVQFKAWIQRATYDEDQASDSAYAHQAFRVEIFDAKQEQVFAETMTANAYGGIAGDYPLPQDAPLGQYRIVVDGQGQGTFRVEEYKKPEFEVEVLAPEEAVMLGGEFEARVQAKYYFGSPVTNGAVKYKVTRTSHTTRWYPPSPWDWLYGSGYGWFGVDMPWYPGWARWGCRAPLPPWFDRGWQRPEVVAEGEALLDDQGQHIIRVNTELAKQLYGDSDHSYRIEAEVVDASRRTIAGSGEVIVARQPFQVFVWLDRGHYKVGETVTASVAARRPDGEPVSGLGKLRLLKISYPDGLSGEPRETEVREWEQPSGADGQTELQIKASEPGRYRLAYELPDATGAAIEGGQVFTISGEGFDGSDFVFNDLEVTPDRRTYKPGDKVQLRVSTNRSGGTVLLFVRAQNGVYPTPQLLQLDGKSTVVELDISASDAPNLFVEALTVSDGKTHAVVREIAVPPASRMLNVEVLPTSKAYLPGQEATVKLRLTDALGEPFVGETVVTVYDKSIEYISGGSNVPDIREHFWSWRHHHSPAGATSLDRNTWNLVPKGTAGMGPLGRFGGELAPDMPRRGTEFFFSRSSRQDAPMAAVMLESAPADADAEGGTADSDSFVTPVIRQNFADTAFWTGSLETDESGFAEVTFSMPENLSTWKMRVWGMGHGAHVGEGSAEVVTRKNLLVRLETPRFLIERDEVVLSANVHNYLSSPKQVTVRLELDDDLLEAPSNLEQTVEIPAGGDRRVDWRLKAARAGDAVVRALALTDEESDAMQLSFPVQVHGIEKMQAFSGVIARDARSGAFEFTVPEQRRPEQTRLEVRYSPTLAGAMVDALPYLVDYPHGCTEQTLNRFLPAVLTQRTLRRMGIDIGQLGGEASQLDPGRRDRPGAADATVDRPSDAWRRMQMHPILDDKKLNEIVDAGVRRLTDMQLSDGGWGWFSGYGERSTPHTTALVVRGLLVAKENDVAVAPQVLGDGISWLVGWQSEQLAKLQNVDAEGAVIDNEKPSKRYADNLDALVHLVLTQAEKPSATMRDLLFRDRTRLSPYAIAMLGVALDIEPDQIKKRDAVITNLKQYLVTDDENQTAYLNLPSSGWWYWYGSEFEAHAYFLKLLTRTEPDSDTAAGLVKYLLANRRHATYWNSTRDTALVVEAMADYLQATGEGRPDLMVEVWLDGERRKEVAITADNLMKFDNRFVVEGVALEPGPHTLEIRKRGGGRLYWNGTLTNFSLEDDIRSAGLDLRIQRRLYKLTPVAAKQSAVGGRGQVVSQQDARFKRSEITNLANVESGNLIEVELTLSSKNDYEYLIITDRKAAGFEPVDLRSGYTGNELGAYVEYRDASVNLFLRQLARGERSVSYRLRAEIPGKYSALPAKTAAMYAPELRGNSDEVKVYVRDAIPREPEEGGASED
ncbi:MAG: MG2 domain-containing protein [Planctomycetota bacterium]